MASVVQILVQARSTAGAALANAGRQVTGLARTVQGLSRTWTQHTRTVSTVNGAYRDANGLWRNANGTLITQRNHLRQVTTWYGRLANSVNRAGSAMSRFAHFSSRAVSTAGRIGSAVAPVALLAGKITLLLAAATSVTGVLGNLLGATQLIAPAAIAAGVAMTVLKMATAGIGDALKAGLSGDVEKFNESLKKLPIHAQEAVKTMVDLAREWKSTQRTVQNRFFMGARDDLIAVSRAIQPVADKWLPRIADMFAKTRTTLRSVFVEAAKSGQLDRIMEGVSRGIGGLLNVLPPLADAFLNIAEVAAPVFGDLGQSAGSLAQKFADWIKQAKESGKLAEWLQKAMDTLRELKEIAGNVGEMLGAIFRGANENGQSLLEKISELTQRMADWLNSDDGQGLIDTLSSILGFVIACKPAFEVLSVVIQAVMAVASAAWGAFFEIVQFVVNWILSGYSMLLSGAEKAFSWIPGVGDKLKAARDQFEKWKNDVNAQIDGVKDTIDITVRYHAVRIGPHMMSGSQLSGNYDSGIGGRASGGAASGIVRVGERGEEIVDFNRRMVLSNNDSRTRAIGGSPLSGGGGGGRTSLTVQVTPGPVAAGDPWVASMQEAFRRGRFAMKVVGTNQRVVPA